MIILLQQWRVVWASQPERKTRSNSYCNLSAGRHGDTGAFNLLEGVVLIVLPTNTGRETEQHQHQAILPAPREGPIRKQRWRTGPLGSSWHGNWGEEAKLHYLQICVIKLTSETLNNKKGRGNRLCLAASTAQTEQEDFLIRERIGENSLPFPPCRPKSSSPESV